LEALAKLGKRWHLGRGSLCQEVAVSAEGEGFGVQPTGWPFLPSPPRRTPSRSRGSSRCRTGRSSRRSRAATPESGSPA